MDISVDDFMVKNKMDLTNDDITFLPNYGSNFIVGDIESSLNENNEWVFNMICLSDGVDLLHFDNLKKCFDYMNNYEEELTIYFHNLDFDMLFFFKEPWFKILLEDVDIMKSGNMTLGFTVGNVSFRNSLSLFPMSLKNIVKKFLHVNDSDYFNEKSNVLYLEEDVLINYCMKDCFYLHNALEKFEYYFRDTFEMELSLTTPSIALKTWKKHFLHDKEFIGLHRRSSFFNDNYYFGGHTEKFTDEKMFFENVNYYDVNSLYPSVMIDTFFIDSKFKRTKPTKAKLKSLIKSETLFFAEIDLNIDSERLRFFPVLNKEHHRNDYPNGTHTIKISEEGLKFILKWGSWDNITKVHNVLIGEEDKKINVFKEYVDYFYKARKSDSGNDVIFKLLLNSLYGKFGQKLERDVVVINSTKREENPKKVDEMDGVYFSTFTEETAYYNKGTHRLDVAGKITEVARLRMGDIMNTVRQNSTYGDDAVIYTDTDSIIVYDDLTKMDSLSHIIDPKKLGLMSDEIGYSDDVYILGQKMYHFVKSGKKATKGIKEMELKDFVDIYNGKHSLAFENKRFSRFNSLINKGFHGIMSVPYMLKNVRGRLDT